LFRFPWRGRVQHNLLPDHQMFFASLQSRRTLWLNLREAFFFRSEGIDTARSLISNLCFALSFFFELVGFLGVSYPPPGGVALPPPWLRASFFFQLSLLSRPTLLARGILRRYVTDDPFHGTPFRDERWAFLRIPTRFIPMVSEWSVTFLAPTLLPEPPCWQQTAESFFFLPSPFRSSVKEVSFSAAAIDFEPDSTSFSSYFPVPAPP